MFEGNLQPDTFDIHKYVIALYRSNEPDHTRSGVFGSHFEEFIFPSTSIHLKASTLEISSAQMNLKSFYLDTLFICETIQFVGKSSMIVTYGTEVLLETN